MKAVTAQVVLQPSGIWFLGALSIVPWLTALWLPFGAAGVVLENDAIRLELEPRTYSIRYLGQPGGPNFVDPLYLTERQHNEPGLVQPGGIMTDVLPVSEADALLRRGPASVVVHRPDYLLLMGPKSSISDLQVKKEYRLHGDQARITYRVSVLSSRKEERPITIRVTAQIPWGASLILPPRPEGGLQLVRGAFPGYTDFVAPSGSNYRVDLARREGRAHAVLKTLGGATSVETRFGNWTRSGAMHSAGEDASSPVQIIALVDDASLTSQIALESTQTGVNVGAPLIYEEEWILHPAGPLPIENDLAANTLGDDRGF